MAWLISNKRTLTGKHSALILRSEKCGKGANVTKTNIITYAQTLYGGPTAGGPTVRPFS